MITHFIDALNQKSSVFCGIHVGRRICPSTLYLGAVRILSELLIPHEKLPWVPWKPWPFGRPKVSHVRPGSSTVHPCEIYKRGVKITVFRVPAHTSSLLHLVGLIVLTHWSLHIPNTKVALVRVHTTREPSNSGAVAYLLVLLFDLHCIQQLRWVSRFHSSTTKSYTNVAKSRSAFAKNSADQHPYDGLWFAAFRKGEMLVASSCALLFLPRVAKYHLADCFVQCIFALVLSPFVHNLWKSTLRTARC